MFTVKKSKFLNQFSFFESKFTLVGSCFEVKLKKTKNQIHINYLFSSFSKNFSVSNVDLYFKFNYAGNLIIKKGILSFKSTDSALFLNRHINNFQSSAIETKFI
jgi:hypothetical protein